VGLILRWKAALRHLQIQLEPRVSSKLRPQISVEGWWDEETLLLVPRGTGWQLMQSTRINIKPNVLTKGKKRPAFNKMGADQFGSSDVFSAMKPNPVPPRGIGMQLTQFQRHAQKMKTLIKILFLALISPALAHSAIAASLSLDPNFNAPFFVTPDHGSRVVLLPNGKYVGCFLNIDTITDQQTSSLNQYFGNGTLDTSFHFNGDYFATEAAALPDGRLIVFAARYSYGQGISQVLRLNLDGSIDNSFNSAATTVTESSPGAVTQLVRTILIQSDGKILLCGLFPDSGGATSNEHVVRLLSDGTIDPDFTSPTFTGSTIGGQGVWARPAIQPDGKIIVANDFTKADNVSCPGVVRLNPNGTLDTTFNAFGFSRVRPAVPIRGALVQSDGKIVLGGKFVVGTTLAALVRLNSDGSIDPSYILSNVTGTLNGANGGIRDMLLTSGDKPLAVALSVYRFNADGSLDSTFSPPVLIDASPIAQVAVGVTVNQLPDGRVLVGGLFDSVANAATPTNFFPRWSVAQFNTDGSLDTSLTTSHKEGQRLAPSSYIRQSDGSTSIAFNQTSLAGFPAIPHNFGRLLSSGALDSSFDPLAALNPNGPLTSSFIALGFTGFNDGSLLVTGFDGASANYGHLLANGNEDPNYHADPAVKFATAFMRSDGKLLVDGFYTIFGTGVANPSAENAANGTQVRLINSDGSVDTSFLLDASIVAATQQRDVNDQLISIQLGSSVLTLMGGDKILFGYLSSDGSYHLVRLNPDGSIDLTFVEVTFPVSVNSGKQTFIDPKHPERGLQTFTAYQTSDTPVKQAKAVLDNKVIVMGSFNSYGGTPAHGLLRVNPNGSPDPTFNIGSGAQWTQTQETGTFHPSIDNLEVGLDDKLLLTGTFEAFNGTAAPGIISLNPDGTADTSFVAPIVRHKFDYFAYQSAHLARQSDGSFLLSGPYSRTTDNKAPSFFRLLLPPGAPTSAGTGGVSTDAGSVGTATDVTTTFSTVGTAGTTSVSIIDPNWAGQLPSGYQIAGANLAFEVYTTASYSGPITICFSVPSLDPAIFAAARVLHNSGSGLVDVTSSKDASTQTICATVSSLSPFVIALPPYKAIVQQPINADGSSVFNVKRGGVPVKFTLTSNGGATCLLPPATISLTRTAGAVLGSIEESTYLLSSDSGSNFRRDGCQYIYNLSTGSLGTGTYKVNISINGVAIGSGTFAVK
jgi:uncharacterized delta-60 repeat protein